jgi:hypothetical protein
MTLATVETGEAGGPMTWLQSRRNYVADKGNLKLLSLCNHVILQTFPQNKKESRLILKY